MEQFCIVIKDEDNNLNLYKIGEEVKTYSLKEDAKRDIDEMIVKEKELFGDVITKYTIAIYEDCE